MRIGIFSDAYLPIINGVVTSIVTLKEGLEQKGHEVFIISNHSKLFEIDLQGNILYLPGFHIKFLFDNNLSTPVQTRALEIIKQMNLDIIHVQTEFGVGLFAHQVAKKQNIPLVATYHTTWEDYTHYINPMHWKQVEKAARKMVAYFTKAITRNAQAIITPSQKTKDLLIHYGVYQPIHVIPTGIDLDRFKESDELLQKASLIRQKYDVKKDEELFVFVGRLGEEKNLEMVIEALEHQPIKMIIVGDGPIIEQLRNKINKLNLQHQIFLLGRIPNVDIAQYYHAGDAFISASLTETQGLTFIEAMACGLSLFASDKEVLSDLLIENENGYYFNTKEELIEKLTKYLSLSKEEKLSFKKKSLEYVIPYRKEIFVDEVETLYTKVLNLNEQEFQVIEVSESHENKLVSISNDLTVLRLMLDQEIIEMYKIVEDRVISVKELSEIKEHDLINKKLTKCLNKLTYHDYSEAQIRTYLNELDDQNQELNEEVIKVLIDKGFVNDERFIYELVNRYKEKGYGLYRIDKSLEKYKFDADLKEYVLNQISDDQQADLNKEFDKLIRGPLYGSLLAVKNKVNDRLIRQGYHASDVFSLVNNHNFDYDETESCQSDIKKLLRKKVDKSEFYQKLKQKGYQHQTIIETLGEIKDEN